jgi:hypothetical protein
MLKELFELNPLCDFNFTARLNEEKTVTVVVTPKAKNNKVTFPSFTCTNTLDKVEEEIVAFFKERMTKINDKCIPSDNAKEFDKELEATEKPKAPVKTAPKTVKKEEVKKPSAPLLQEPTVDVEAKEEPKAGNTPTAELLKDNLISKGTAILEEGITMGEKKEETKPVEKPKFTF